jgi:hypothetical protein
MAKKTNIVAASLNASEAFAFLPAAAQAAIDGKATVEQGKAKGAAALAVMTAGLASDEAALLDWSFDIVGNDGAVHDTARCTGYLEFGRTGEFDWGRNMEGATSKVAQTGYKTGFLNRYFNLPSPVAAVWLAAGRAVTMARAIRAEGMTASLVGGQLVLEGGTSEKAEQLRAAKSVTALLKLAEGKAGTDRAAPQNAAAAAPELVEATPEEVLRAAASLCAAIVKGKVAATNPALSFARSIALLVSKNPEAFAEA